MNKLKNLYTIVVFFISSYGNGQMAADTAFEKTVFWQITGNGLTDTSYLFGTMHPVFREDVHIAENMLSALLNSKTVFFEHALYNTGDSAYIEISRMEKPVLRRLLGGICFELLEKHLEKYNDTLLSSPLLLQLDPGYIGARVIKNIFGPAVTSIDATIMAIALGNGQPVSYLDTREMEQELKELIPLDEKATQLYYFLRNIEKAQRLYIKQVKDFTRLYYSGNFGYIYTRTTYLQINDRLGGLHITANSLSEKMLDNRNKKWLPAMTAAIQKQSSFFAVGAAHLAGSAGLINLLRKKGFTLTPIFLEYKQD
jgi:uncharacterized protein YbaP (TraB family)